MTDPYTAGMISTDPFHKKQVVEGRIVAVNEYMVQLLGSPSVEASMQFNLLTLPQLVDAGISAAVARTMDTGHRHVGEYTYESAWKKSVLVRLVKQI